MPLIPRSKVNSYPSYTNYSYAGDVVFEGVVNTFYKYPNTLTAGTYVVDGLSSINYGNIAFNTNSQIWPDGPSVGSPFIFTIPVNETGFVFQASIGNSTQSYTTYDVNSMFSDGTNLWSISGWSGYLGTANISTDGITWSQKNIANLTTISSGTYNGSVTNKYIVVTTGAAIYTSTDGNTWTSRTSAISGWLSEVIINSAATNKYIVISQNGSLASSTDGVTWTSRTSGFGTSAIYSIATNGTASTNQIYVAVGKAGTLTSSTDGVTWTSRTSGFGTTDIWCVNWLNGAYWAVAQTYSTYAAISTSTDGITWTIKYTPSNTFGFSNYFTTIGYVNGYYLTGGPMYASTDGNSWFYAGSQSGGTTGQYGGTKCIIYYNNTLFCGAYKFSPTWFRLSKVSTVSTLV